MCLASTAQIENSSILFSNESYLKLSAQSKKSGKPIFIDFYAEWCGPCKWMEHNVFNDDTVAQLMNDHFLSLRVDAEKEEQQLVTQLNISAYPTFIIMDPTGQLVTKQEGAVNSDQFISMVSSNLHLKSYKEEYQKNKARAESVYDYANALKWNNPKAARRIVINFLKSTSDKKWSKPEYWQLIEEFVPGTHLVIMDKVQKNGNIKDLYPDRYKLFIQEKIKDILNKSIQLKSQYHLSRYIGYINNNSDLFTNSDSLILISKIQYADATKSLTLTLLLEAIMLRLSLG